MGFTGKVVLVTGASGGLGTAVTAALLDAGVRVVGASASIQGAGEHFAAISVKLSSADDCRRLVMAATDRWGRLDGLVHLIGGFAGGTTVAETDDDVFDHMWNINFRLAFQMIRAVLPGLRNQGTGRIIAIGSKAAVETQAHVGAYAASKAALISLVRTVARENADRGVTANIILPGTMDTPANRAAMPDADPSKWVQPTQVAKLITHLVSDEASQISGASIPVYGIEA